MKEFLIGHAQNKFTGVSVVLCPEGAVGGVDVRGGAPGTRETDLLRGANSVKRVHAVTLCGGSAFGLESCCGVMKHLYAKNIGFETAIHKVPIVTGAVLFDLNDPTVLHYPDIDMGEAACKNAVADNTTSGSIGAGTGATVGKIMGAGACMKGGVGVAELNVFGVTVRALVAVNAFGDVYDCRTDKIVAGAKAPDGNFLDTAGLLTSDKLGALMAAARGGQNTTIGVIMTDADLTREEANKLASVSHDGLALSVRPVHTMADGDTMFALASGGKQCDFNVLCVACVEATRRAVLNAVGYVSK